MSRPGRACPNKSRKSLVHHIPNSLWEAASELGGVIRPQAIAMQLAANLPGDLWPETWQAAAYIHNRSPREQNESGAAV
jgi:hypothetical protein